MDTNQKSWKDRMPPDGHLPASYEVQVCDEGNKTIAVQMLDKAGLKYKISARKGQFFIQACDMQTFTQVKRVLDQSLDMAKEANHLGFPPEVTPVGTNTPQADVTAATVAVEPKPVKEELKTKRVEKNIGKNVELATKAKNAETTLRNIMSKNYTMSKHEHVMLATTLIKQAEEILKAATRLDESIVTEMEDESVSLNEGYPSEKTHENAFQEVLDVLNSLGFDIGAKGYNLNYSKKPGNGFNARYIGDFFEQHKMEKQLVDALMKKGFKFGVPSSEKSALEWFLIKNPVYVRFSTSNKQLFINCDRLD